MPFIHQEKENCIVFYNFQQPEKLLILKHLCYISILLLILLSFYCTFHCYFCCFFSQGLFKQNTHCIHGWLFKIVTAWLSSTLFFQLKYNEIYFASIKNLPWIPCMFKLNTRKKAETFKFKCMYNNMSNSGMFVSLLIE